jgi:DNA-binding HxlR family transcriptional regulator
MRVLIQSIKNHEIKLGEPWKLPGASGFLIPLISDKAKSERNYILLQEAEDQVEFRDSGGISGVDALNRSGKNVYIRKGTMLKGTGTQNRAPVSSYVLTPDDNYVRIPVNCIHQSHGISKGSVFKAQGVAPMEVYSSLGEQSRTWASISNYSRKVQKRTPGLHSGPIRHDDLLSVESKIEMDADAVVDALKNIPGDHVNQVGVAVFDPKGVVAVELFDHPASWRAFSESIIRSYRQVLTEEAGDLIEIRTEKAEEVFMRFLTRVEDFKSTLLSENSVSKIWGLNDTDFEGELAEVEGEEIHLIISRASREHGPPPFIRAESLRIEPEVQRITDHVSEAASEEFIQKKGGYNILSELSQTPQRFSELLDLVDVSRGTLATRIKEAEDIGLIEKGIRASNGSPAYTLTRDGEKTKKKLDKKAK